MKSLLKFNSQKGFSPILLILLAAIGLILYILISNTFSFKDRLFSLLYPKPTPRAQEVGVSVPDEILLKFKPGISEQAKDNVLKRYNIEIKETIPGIDVAVTRVPEQAKDKLIEALNNNPFVEYAEPNFIRQAITIPNDEKFPSQWTLPKIAAPAGWDISTGSSQVVIAIIDTGVNLDHEDLKDKVSGEMDVHEHGTAVAGVAGASTNNGKGIAGVCWLCPILSIQKLNSTGSGSDGAIASGITSAADSGAKVINLSLGGYDDRQTLQYAVNYAWSKGAVVVAGAGNDGTSKPFYPAASDNVIAVGMTNFLDVRDPLSNYGSWLDVMAPGVNIYTTLKGGGYGIVSGTSMAAPHVSGLAGLIFSANPALSNQQVVDIITQTADDLGDPGFDIYYGWGKINVAKALQKATGTTGPLPDNLSPQVTGIQPADGSTVSGTTTIKVDVKDNVGVTKVEVRWGGTDVALPYLIGTDTQAPYEFLWDTTKIADRTVNLQVSAYDAAGNKGTGQVNNITINNTNTDTTTDTTKPQTSITYPTEGLTVSSNVTIQASASDNVSVSAVSFFIDGIFLGEDFSSPYEIAWDTTKETNGSHIIQSKATDSSGNVGESSVVTVTVNNSTPTPSPTPTLTPAPTSEPIPTPNPILPDATNPTVSITNPADGSTVVRNTNVNITADATDNVKVSKVEFLINNSVKCTDTSSPYTCTWKVPGKRGVSYTLTAKAYDPSNNTSSATITVKTQ